MNHPSFHWKRLNQVPYRCLVPADSVSFIIGKGGATIRHHKQKNFRHVATADTLGTAPDRQMSESCGATLSILKDGEAPATLADKIVIISGPLATWLRPGSTKYGLSYGGRNTRNKVYGNY